MKLLKGLKNYFNNVICFYADYYKWGCEKTRLSFFTSPFLYLLCIND